MKCPKCKTGRLYGQQEGYTYHVIKCHTCGLSHAIGTSRESLYRQINRQLPAATQQRLAAMRENN